MPAPDFVITYDFPGYTDVFFREAKDEFGVDKVAHPERFVLFIDHISKLKRDRVVKKFAKDAKLRERA